MKILFGLVAVCPAIFMTVIEMKNEEKIILWKGILKFLAWFYFIIFFNLTLLYLRGWKEFAFERISVQFLIKYMISSMVITITLVMSKYTIRKFQYDKKEILYKENMDSEKGFVSDSNKVDKHSKKEKLVKVICAIFCIFSTGTFFLNMDLKARSGEGFYSLIVDFQSSFSNENFILTVILIPLLYHAYLYCIELYRKKFASIKSSICIVVPSILFAAFMVIGTSFVKDNSLHLIFENELQLLKSLFAFAGYFAVFFFGIIWVFDFLDNVELCENTEKKHIKLMELYLHWLKKRPFIVTFITLFIVYLPYIIASYPVIFLGDATHQISLVYGLYELNNAHPIMHTLLIKMCIQIGTMINGSVNFGLFLYSMLQFIFVLTAIALLIKLLFSIKISSRVSIALILYYIFHPRIQNYMIVMTKDVINAIFLLAFMISLYMLFTKKSSRILYILLGVSDLGALLFRHDSAYLIIISMVIIFFLLKDFRKQIIIVTICTLFFTLFWNHVFLPAFHIKPNKPWTNPNTGILECIMIQQTARYIRDAGDEVTKEEKEAISAFFDYDKMVANYTPDSKSDGAASAIRRSATAEDWASYQKAWFNMFFKHPEIYMEATLNLKYDHLYPLVFNKCSYYWSTKWMENTNGDIEIMPNKIYYPKNLSKFRLAYETLRESFSNVPILNISFMTASYMWTLFTWFAYCICRKKKIAIAIMMPLLILVLVLVAGPTNARFFRYLYPYAFCLPPIIILGLYGET